MIEAVQNLSPGDASKNAPSAEREASLPFFNQGQVWPELPYLPQANELGRPPHYVLDMLVDIYFDQLEVRETSSQDRTGSWLEVSNLRALVAGARGIMVPMATLRWGQRRPLGGGSRGLILSTVVRISLLLQLG
ncbi:hypothetical protein BJX62DRAFT_120657 [Aspergillus germanicus]